MLRTAAHRPGRAASRWRRRRRAGSSAARRPTSTKPSERVERLRDGVVGAHLEEHLARRRAARASVEQRARAAPDPDPGPADALGDRDRLDVGIRRPARRAQPGVADQAPGLFDDDVPAVRRRELSRIIASDQASVGNDARSSAMIASRSCERCARRACSLRPPASGRPSRVTSGERRYSGVGGGRHAPGGERAAGDDRDHRARDARRRRGASAPSSARRASSSSRGTSAGSVDPHRQPVVVDPVVDGERELAAARIGDDRERRVGRRRIRRSARACSSSSSATASWLTTGTTGMPRPSANARAAAMPTRSPVKGPGPCPRRHV